jgi:hypothetical protein
VISTNGSLFGGGGSQSGGDTTAANNVSVPDQLVGAMLKHRMQLPLVDDILKQLGINSPSPKDITNGLGDSFAATPQVATAEQIAN